MLCSICCAYDTASEIESIQCPYCAFTTCVPCAKTYVLSRVEDPSCMACRKEWTTTFLMENTDRKWVTTIYKPHIGRIIMEREKMLLPYTQHHARMEQEIRALRESIITHKLHTKKAAKDPDAMAMRRHIQMEIGICRNQCCLYNATASISTSNIANKATVMICKCPMDSCRGYVDDSYACGTCSSSICQKCHQITDTITHSHKCNPDDVASVRLIRSDTKPCPKCCVPIYKAGGCDQMFCVECHVAFSWTTGALETGAIHNPYYFEWLANNAQNNATAHLGPRQMDDIACGELPTDFEMARMMQIYQLNFTQQIFIFSISRVANHFENVILPHFRTDRVRDNMDLRVYYLVGDLTEDQWTSKLAHREFRRLKLRAIYELCNTVITVMRDLLRTTLHRLKMILLILNQTSPPPNEVAAVLNDINTQFSNFQAYYKTALDDIKATHGGQIPAIVPSSLRNT